MNYAICALYGQEKRILKLTHRGAAAYLARSVIYTIPLFCDKIAVCVAITMGLIVQLMQWLPIKLKKSFAKFLAAVDDRRKIILLQRVKNVPKTFLEKWAWPPANHTFLCLSLRHRGVIRVSKY